MNGGYSIYLITFEDGYVYVGKTKKSINYRYKQHKNSIHKHNKLYQHWVNSKQDPSIECLESCLSCDKARELEREYTIAYMNMTDKVLNENIGSNLSDDTKSKISESRKGKYCGKNNSFYGKTHTDETKNKISVVNKGKLLGENNPMYGKTHTDEVKQILSLKAMENNKGENNPMYGKHHSKESIDKIKLAHSRPKEYYSFNPTSRPSFKRTCSRYEWNFDNFEEIFHSYRHNIDGSSTRLYIYIYLEDMII